MMASKKHSLAKELLLKACGKLGIWAGLGRYANQYWTRDLSYSLAYFLLFNDKQDLLKKHICQLIKRQRKNGQIPILFIEKRFGFVINKLRRSLNDRKLSFMLKRFLQGKLWNLTPGTRDSEINFLSLMYRYATLTGDYSFVENNLTAISKAMSYIQSNLLNTDGLVLGGDWRDTMHEEFANKPVLVNNAMFYYILKKCGKSSSGEKVKENLQSIIDDQIKSAGTRDFDPLGLAFSVLYDLVDQSRYNELENAFNKSLCDFGVKATCPHNPLSEKESEVISRTEGTVVWPFISAYVVIALIKMGKLESAKDHFEKLDKLNEFYEWYDPFTGKGYGEKCQLWGAAMFMIAQDHVNNKQVNLI